jgi:hypothetical protein
MGAPGASPLGTWESTDLGLGKLKSFIPHRLLPASRPAFTDQPDTPSFRSLFAEGWGVRNYLPANLQIITLPSRTIKKTAKIQPKGRN